MLYAYRRRCVALASAIAAGAIMPAFASHSGVGMESPMAEPSAAAGYVVFSHIPATSDQVVIWAENAKVHVKRSASAGDITVASVCPRDWNVNGSIIRQAGFTKPRSGVAMMADALGSRAIVNGKIYPLPNGQIMGGMQLGKDGVIIGGQKVEPLKGSDVPGNTSGPDALEVTVPDSYTGGLILGVSSDSEVDIQSWKGGALNCTMLGNANLKAGALTSLTKAVLDLKGQGKADIADIDAKVFVANISGPGELNIKSGSADISNATVSGDGSIIMKGRFNNLKQSIEGNGKIKVN